LFEFFETGVVSIQLGGVKIFGTYELNAEGNIATINSWFSAQDVDFFRLSTSLVLQGGTLEGTFASLYGDALIDALEEINGVRLTNAQGNLSGRRIRSKELPVEEYEGDLAGMAEAIPAMQ
jgi:hypothetical protein